MCSTCKNRDRIKTLFLYEKIFEELYNWIVVVDKDGYIVVMNKPYANFLEVDHKKVIGKHVTDVIENTRMHIVVKTGKEMFARAIHNESLRASKPLIKINCAYIPSGLLESELFGYEYASKNSKGNLRKGNKKSRWNKKPEN